MNDTLPTESPPPHDEIPARLGDGDVLMPRAVPPWGEIAALVERRRALLASDRYLLLAHHLDEDPMGLVRDMAEGRYRFKRRRHDGTLWLDEGRPVGERMSMRQASAELKRLTGYLITYETLRRWWIKVWPEEPPPDQTRPVIPPAVFRAPGD
jgi:hypothetical protein